MAACARVRGQGHGWARTCARPAKESEELQKKLEDDQKKEEEDGGGEGGGNGHSSENGPDDGHGKLDP